MLVLPLTSPFSGAQGQNHGEHQIIPQNENSGISVGTNLPFIFDRITLRQMPASKKAETL